MATQSHESLASFRQVSVGSDRKFGLTVGAILAVLAVWPLVRHHQPIRVWLLVVGVLLVSAGALAPAILAPLNRAWFRLGLLLARITNPIVMGIMYFAAVVPIGWILRRRGNDLLRLRREPDAESYWIVRDPDVPTSLTKQF